MAVPPCTFVSRADGLSPWVQALTSKAIAATPQPAILATRARRAPPDMSRRMATRRRRALTRADVLSTTMRTVTPPNVSPDRSTLLVIPASWRYRLCSEYVSVRR